ncbi:MAG: glycosyltransferase family 2 protein [Leadbetterella sp.]|nr:glycosyltransferase family 2 protein [Leadbetterella sp.]
MTRPQVNIIVPLFNEEEVFGELIKRLERLINSSKLSIEVILVDDGSKDATPLKMRELSLSNARFHSVILSRNFGHQLALTAGLKYVNATDAVLIIDGDLQDPPELLDEFYGYYKQGYDVVYAVRKKRKESFFKRLAYDWFYRFLKKVSYIDIPLDSGDFSLISTSVVKQLNAMPEESRFLRGMRSWIGFKQIGVEYEREKRFTGDSKYPFSKLVKLALNGIFNFSEYPIKFISSMGIGIIFISFLYFFYVIIKKVFFGQVPAGFPALLFMIILFGGIQLLAIGIIGEYILRIFFQVKNRPLFITKERIANKTVQEDEEVRSPEVYQD